MAATRPERIVSLVPSHTESLAALGVADHVVGRTRFGIHPEPWVDSVPHVGGTKDASLEKILALRPDLVVADKDENPKALVDGLLESGVDVLWSDIDDIDGATDFLVTLADKVGAGAEDAVQAIAAARSSVQGAEPVPVFCPIWYGPWMTFDASAYSHAMLAEVGLLNVFGDHAGPKYFEVEAKDVAASEAVATLLPTEPYPFHTRRDAIDTSGLGAAGAPDAVHIIDGEALTWFGVRTADGLRALAEVRAQLD